MATTITPESTDLPLDVTRQDGGKGSGNWEYKGRPGLVGGSGEGEDDKTKKTYSA